MKMCRVEIFPTDKQIVRLNTRFDMVKWVYNYFLQKIEEDKSNGKKPLTMQQMINQLPQILPPCWRDGNFRNLLKGCVRSLNRRYHYGQNGFGGRGKPVRLKTDNILFPYNCNGLDTIVDLGHVSVAIELPYPAIGFIQFVRVVNRNGRFFAFVFYDDKGLIEKQRLETLRNRYEKKMKRRVEGSNRYNDAKRKLDFTLQRLEQCTQS